VLGPVLKLDRNLDSSSGFPGEEFAGVDGDDTEMDGWNVLERDEDKEDENVDDPEPCFNSVGKTGGIIFDSTNSGGPVSSSK